MSKRILAQNAAIVECPGSVYQARQKSKGCGMGYGQGVESVDRERKPSVPWSGCVTYECKRAAAWP